MAVKQEPIFSAKAVLIALENAKIVSGAQKKYKLTSYDGWKDKNFTRGRFTIYTLDDKIVSYFVHISKNIVKIWLPGNARGPADHILEGNFGV